jgi:hypothetical protein
MGPVRLRQLVLAAIALVSWAATASAAPILITFEDQTAGMNVPDGLTTSDSSEVRFSDTVGANLVIVNSAIASAGSNALAVFTDNDDSALQIDFDFVAEVISMDIGNDAAAFSQPGDRAVLTVFLNLIEVGSTSLALNRNSAMDQTIVFDGNLFGGVTFNSATLKFDVDPSSGLVEVVDNVSVTPIPEPGAVVAFGAGALLVGLACGRRVRSETWAGLGARRG